MNGEITETMEVLRICERLRPTTRAIFISVGKVLSEDDGMHLADLLIYWLRIPDRQRLATLRILQLYVEEMDLQDLDVPYRDDLREVA